MRFTKQQYEDFVLVFENEGEFYRRYTSGGHFTYGQRREVIAQFLRDAPRAFASWFYLCDIEDRDQLRQYFDARWGIPQKEVNKYDYCGSVWDDPPSMRIVIPASTFTPTPPENTMSQAIEVTTQTLVNGKDVKGMSDSQIYELIREQEAAIKDLEKIEAKPKKLTAEIAKRKAGIAALVAHLDAQPA